MRSLTLYIQGLFGPDTPLSKGDLPLLPALNWFLGRSKRRSLKVGSYSYQLCHLFGFEKEPDSDYPIAAISRLGDDCQPSGRPWMHADPVHVTADKNGLTMLDSTSFSMSQSEALVLAAELNNKVLAARGMSLEVPAPYRWYIKLAEPQQIITTPIDMVVGKDILPFMPTGDDRIAWVQLLNEIQMVLHDAELNRQREQEEKLPVNSLWFWGSGELPGQIDQCWSWVIGDDILAKGLAMIAATPYRELPDRLPVLEDNGKGFNGLISFQCLQRFNYYHDLDAWVDSLLNIEENWFTPLYSEFMDKRLDQITLHTDSMLFTLDTRARYRFWRKRQDILSFKNKTSRQVIHA